MASDSSAEPPDWSGFAAKIADDYVQYHEFAAIARQHGHLDDAEAFETAARCLGGLMAKYRITIRDS